MNIFSYLQIFSLIKEETEFIGMIVGKDWIKMDPDMTKVMKEWPNPNFLFDVRCFICLLQFFRRFIKIFSGKSAPLTSLTKKGRGMKDWYVYCDMEFECLKRATIKAPVPSALDWNICFRFQVDASQCAVEGTFTQIGTDRTERLM